jgi:hypothetical protein
LPQQLLAINPDNEYALKGMQALAGESALKREPSQEASASAAAAPMSPPLLCRSSPILVMHSFRRSLMNFCAIISQNLPIPWASSGHTGDAVDNGERGAARLKRITYAAAAMVVLLVAAGIVYAVQNLGLFESEDQVALLPTRIPTLTATVTLTPT